MTKKAHILPGDKNKAIQAMVKTTKKLIGIADSEAKHLAVNDLLSFAIMQDEKQKLSKTYIEMSQEFRSRLEEFRGIDPALLNELEGFQKQLGEKTRDNNKIVERVRVHAQNRTQDTLLSAQELAQKRPVEFEDNQQTGT